MKKYLLAYILIFFNIFLIAGCGKQNTLDNITGTTMDIRVENTSGSIVELITVEFDKSDFDSIQEMYDYKSTVLSYLTTDTVRYLNAFSRLARQSMALSPETKQEYINRAIIDYDSKDVVNSEMIQFQMAYLNSYIRQVWYIFVDSYDADARSGVILDYRDPEVIDMLNGATNESDEVEVLHSSGTWFNKSYILDTSIYSYALIPYPTFKKEFIDQKDDITFTQTLITFYDDLKCNAAKETKYQGGIVERTWVILDIDGTDQIEYFTLEANRLAWYILALSISVFVVILLFVAYFIKLINKKRVLPH